MKKIILKLVLTFVAVSPLHAEITPDQIDQAAADVQGQVVEWRRWFHQNPELSNREYNTGARIAEILTEMGLEPITGMPVLGLII